MENYRISTATANATGHHNSAGGTMTHIDIGGLSMEKSFAVKALQITPESVEECLRLVRGSAEMDREQGLVLHTPYGKKIARYGDWIVELAHGGFDVHKDEPQEDQIDSVLRSFGYDPVLIGLRGKVFAEVCLENMRLKQRIMELEDEIERRRKSHELSLDALMKANLEAEIVATLPGSTIPQP